MREALRRQLARMVMGILLPPDIQASLEHRLSVLEQANERLHQEFQNLKSRVDEFTGIKASH